MKHNPDVVWTQAEILAKNLVSGMQILKEQNESKDEIERYENNLKKITGECSKVQFMDILANAEKYIPKQKIGRELPDKNNPDIRHSRELETIWAFH